MQQNADVFQCDSRFLLDMNLHSVYTWCLELGGLEKVSLIVKQRLKLCIKSPSGVTHFQWWHKVNQQLAPYLHLWCTPRIGNIQDLHCWLTCGVDMCSQNQNVLQQIWLWSFPLCIKHHLRVMYTRMLSLTVRYLYTITPQDGDLELCIYSATSVMGL